MKKSKFTEGNGLEGDGVPPEAGRSALDALRAGAREYLSVHGTERRRAPRDLREAWGRVALVTASHARTAEGESNRPFFREATNLRLILSPEHGLDGCAEAGEAVGDSADPLTGVPVHSLYQPGVPAEERAKTLRAALQEIDSIVYDLPDVGLRFYTYISTGLELIEQCAANEAGTGPRRFVLLDRPNPLGGEVCEGPCLGPEDFSFVGPYSLPIRYGLSFGELARLYVQEKELDLQLEVYPLPAWRRRYSAEDFAEPYQMPSPGLPNLTTLRLYPGTCLFEGTNLSEGRGTSRPLSWFGAPWLDAERLARIIAGWNIPGLAVRPQTFIPQSSKHAGKVCRGLCLEITDRNKLRSVDFVLRVLKHLAMHEAEFKILEPAGEDTRSHLQLLLGREWTDLADLPEPETYAVLEAQVGEAFRRRAQKALIYD